MLSVRRWVEFSFLNYVKERIANIITANSRTFMCQASSNEDHRPPVVMSWHETTQPFFNTSENMSSGKWSNLWQIKRKIQKNR